MQSKTEIVDESVEDLAHCLFVDRWVEISEIAPTHQGQKEEVDDHHDCQSQRRYDDRATPVSSHQNVANQRSEREQRQNDRQLVKKFCVGLEI